jgi:hypothetical protein
MINIQRFVETWSIIRTRIARGYQVFFLIHPIVDSRNQTSGKVKTAIKNRYQMTVKHTNNLLGLPRTGIREIQRHFVTPAISNAINFR